MIDHDIVARVHGSQYRARSILESVPRTFQSDEIAAHLLGRGTPDANVKKFTDAMTGNCARRERSERAERHRAEIRRMNAAGLTDGDIARALGLSRPYVCQVRSAEGIRPVARHRRVQVSGGVS